jgi:hypothetical protein
LYFNTEKTLSDEDESDLHSASLELSHYRHCRDVEQLNPVAVKFNYDPDEDYDAEMTRATEYFGANRQL